MPAGDSPTPYPTVPAQVSFPEIEAAIVAKWEKEATFEASVERRRAAGAPEYVFYDGPPFANGLPHYGHLLTGFVKDAVPRYQTMRGKRVERRWGWDCHGLPAEMKAEQDLGVSGRQAILEYGMDRFNAYCRSLVEGTADDWVTYVSRQARWVDLDNAYRTMDHTFMESVLWALKTLHDKGLLYEGYRVLPYCWECETPLSNFETRQDNSYRDRQDPAVTVAFTLEDGRKILVWTTTPWTLPSNLALAVGPDIAYVPYTEAGGTTYLVAEARAGAYEAQLSEAVAGDPVPGSSLVGLRYEPLFPFFADRAAQGAFVVLAADFVTTEDGTGVVHMAPGFGEDDQRACAEAGIEVVCPVDERGRFTSEVPAYAGQQVFDANKSVIADLKAAGALVRHDSYNHSYPHCWRTDTPLIYKAVSSWFVKVTAFKDRMVELNEEINWVPGYMRGSFRKWLEGARDWSISRNRYWGTPIPVWKSDDPAYPRIDVYGSLDELERDFGVRPADLHRPAIDELTRPNPDDPTGKSTMRRIEDVLDCWFDSGSMPFAQVHYPFEHAEWFEDHFPADFICEYIGQTRGWFYTLHVLSTALFDRPAFKTCVAHGIVLGDDGQKLSKRLKNYPDPIEVFDTLGSDAMRWALLSSPVLRGGDLIVDKKFVAEAIRSVLSPLWNSWSFFTLYANAAGYRATPRADSADLLDRYLLAKTSALVTDVQGAMDGDDISGACAAVRSYLDALTNWYIRRSRDRFWAGEEAAFDTLALVLETVCQVTAPLLPLVTESIWAGLRGEDTESIHLSDWPTLDALPFDPGLVSAMDRVRDVCSAGHSVRKAAGRRARLPLPSVTVAGPAAAGLEAYADLVADELNVKAARFSPSVEGVGELVLTVNPKVAGPRIGGAVQQVIKAVKAGEWTRLDDGRVSAADVTLEEGEFELRLTPADEATTRALPGNDTLVVVDIETTPELEAEGLARDVVRLIQEARRAAGLDVSDRIHLGFEGPADVEAAVEAHRDYLTGATLAVSLVFAPRTNDSHRGELSDGRVVHIGITKA